MLMVIVLVLDWLVSEVMWMLVNVILKNFVSLCLDLCIDSWVLVNGVLFMRFRNSGMKFVFICCFYVNGLNMLFVLLLLMF